MNVQSIHNATFNKNLPPTYLAQARDLANWHEYYSFSDSNINGIGNSQFRRSYPSHLNKLTNLKLPCGP